MQTDLALQSSEVKIIFMKEQTGFALPSGKSPNVHAVEICKNALQFQNPARALHCKTFVHIALHCKDSKCSASPCKACKCTALHCKTCSVPHVSEWSQFIVVGNKLVPVTPCFFCKEE